MGNGVYYFLDMVFCRHARDVSNPKTQTVVPKSLRPLVIEMLHSRSGHLGIHKTLEKVKERFFWPGYEQEIRDAVRSCYSCQYNSAAEARQASFTPFVVSTDGMLGREANFLLKRLAQSISIKWEKPLGQTTRRLRAKLSFAIL